VVLILTFLLKESQFAFAVGDQHIFCLPVMVEHHFMCFPAEARFFVTAKWGVRGVSVVTVNPYPACLNGAWHLV